MTYSVQPIETARRRAPRLAGDARRQQIVLAACEFFADHGFSGPTRDLAASIGVTQALLYRYFDSKTALIDAVFSEVLRSYWAGDAVDAFRASAGAPMVDRIADVYGRLLPELTGIATRLFYRAGLDQHAGPVHRGASRNWPLWTEMLEEWRREEGLLSLSIKPMLEGERSLMLAMHNAMFTIRVREHVLRVARTLDDVDDIRQVAEVYDAGARAVMKKLHGVDASGPRAEFAEPVKDVAA
ncbi:MAG: helix-turn-helix domain-containing protein [Hansschlegelia sp.]